MPELKKEIKPLSDFIYFELENNLLLDPPKIGFRLSPIYPIDTIDGIDESGGFRFKNYYVNAILNCVQEWDLTKNGKIILLDDDTRRRNLLPLLNAKVKGKNQLLANAIYKYAANLENFLKN